LRGGNKDAAKTIRRRRSDNALQHFAAATKLRRQMFGVEILRRFCVAHSPQRYGTTTQKTISPMKNEFTDRGIKMVAGEHEPCVNVS
jgi:hypothetical protein